MIGRWFKKLQAVVTHDEFLIQALEDQKKADYPGCSQGLMQCRAFCNCTLEDIKNARWITARAANLRRFAGCKHEKVVPFHPSMFPEFQMGHQCLECKAVNRINGGGWEWEN